MNTLFSPGSHSINVYRVHHSLRVPEFKHPQLSFSLFSSVLSTLTKDFTALKSDTSCCHAPQQLLSERVCFYTLLVMSYSGHFWSLTATGLSSFPRFYSLLSFSAFLDFDSAPTFTSHNPRLHVTDVSQVLQAM